MSQANPVDNMHEISQTLIQTGAHFVKDFDPDKVSDIWTNQALNSKPSNCSFVEMSILLRGCCWLEHAESISTCFVWDSNVPCNTITKMKSCVMDFSQPDVDLVLEHLTPVTRRVCSSSAGLELLKTILINASDRAVEDFIKRGAVLDVVCMYYGCLLIQFLLHLPKPTVVSMIVHNLFIDNTTFEVLSTHTIANYAVQEVVCEMSNPDFEMCLETILEHASILSLHKHGAFVLQAVLDRIGHSMRNHKETSATVAYLRKIVACLISLGDRLVVDRYGNFSTQEMIPLLPFAPFLANKFAALLSENFVKYSADFFGHRVVEAFLKRLDVPANKLLVKTFLELNDYDMGRCVGVKWGKFVVQKVWTRATPKEKRQILRKLNEAGYAWIAPFITSPW